MIESEHQVGLIVHERPEPRINICGLYDLDGISLFQSGGGTLRTQLGGSKHFCKCTFAKEFIQGISIDYQAMRLVHHDDGRIYHGPCFLELVRASVEPHQPSLWPTIPEHFPPS
eukprot:TRINITY_DN11776_c0_g3_i8.p5 TRINITY_DN11776_c0_g3~~TRINITY_DN11776_c0_g3_i8.p5  ORF type:complete len:114 (-),score=2.67 TRINITY_DN11776_c0_g3_i8:121-462(-)